jgi:ribosomal peptide maturation radical SAM protein 1
LSKIFTLHRVDESAASNGPHEISQDVPSASSAATSPVVLVSMPFGYLFRPSLSLSLVKALLLERNIPARLLYAHFQFAELIGRELYVALSNERPDRFTFAAEWLFSGALFPQSAADHQAYFEQVRQTTSVPESYISDVIEARKKIDAFLDGCLQQVLADQPGAVVFTSVLQQQFPALALAKRIKAVSPSTLVVFAGIDWEGAMAAEIVRQFPFINAAVAGEPEIIVPHLLQRQLAGHSIDYLQGVYTPSNIDNQTTYVAAPPVRDLDALPYPDYDDFFEQLDACTVDRDEEPRLQFETSRGCWWGEKQHCTFCGLVGVDMTYRSKSPARALAELKYLVDRYPGYPIWAVDYILDMKYFRDLIPQLASNPLGVELFYEIKSNIKKDQLRMLRDAGVKELQPGIESFSDEILTMMRKGNRGLQNIQVLKWCKEFGIRPYWNVLWGFPGEPAREYERMAKFVPQITHLEPPEYGGPIGLQRYSPNYDFADRFGFVNVAPQPAYRFLYPFDDDTIKKLAQRFVFEYREPHDVGSYTDALLREVTMWQQQYEHSDLFFADVDSRLMVWDFRPGATKALTVLSGFERQLYLACDSCRTQDELLHLAAETRSCSAETIADLLTPLVERGLMIRDGDSYLSLAIPLGDYSPSEAIQARFYEVVEQMGMSSGELVVLPAREMTIA